MKQNAAGANRRTSCSMWSPLKSSATVGIPFMQSSDEFQVKFSTCDSELLANSIVNAESFLFSFLINFRWDSRDSHKWTDDTAKSMNVALHVLQLPTRSAFNLIMWRISLFRINNSCVCWSIRWLYKRVNHETFAIAFSPFRLSIFLIDFYRRTNEWINIGQWRRNIERVSE